jgi:hypothetical protein
MNTVNLMGQTLTQAHIEKLRESGVRVIEHGHGYTEDYCPWRTNLVLNADYEVVETFQG